MTAGTSRILKPLIDGVIAMIKQHTFFGTTDLVFSDIKIYFTTNKLQIPDGMYPCVFIYIPDINYTDYGVGRGRRRWDVDVTFSIMFKSFKNESGGEILEVYKEEVDRMFQLHPRLDGFLDNETGVQRANVTSVSHEFAMGSNFILDKLDFDVEISLLPHNLDG